MSKGAVDEEIAWTKRSTRLLIALYEEEFQWRLVWYGFNTEEIKGNDECD